MCDEIKLFGMLSRIDERTEMMQEQQSNIFERLGVLEQKSPVCQHHADMVRSLSDTETDVKVNGVKIVFVTTAITTSAVLFLTWIINSMA